MQEAVEEHIISSRGLAQKVCEMVKELLAVVGLDQQLPMVEGSFNDLA